MVPPVARTLILGKAQVAGANARVAASKTRILAVFMVH